MAKTWNDAADSIENGVISVNDYIEGLGSTLEKINSDIDDMQSQYSSLNDVVQEYNAYGGLSIDSLQKLLALDDKYLECLSLKNGVLVINNDLLKQNTIAMIDAKIAQAKLSTETEYMVPILEAMKTAIENGTDAFNGMGSAGEKLQTIFSNIKDLFSSLLDIFNKFNDKKSNDLKIQGDAWIDVIDKRIDALNEQNEAQERAIELQKAEDALAKAQANKTTRVYGENGYEWEADASAVRDAQSDLNSKRREYKKQEEIDRLNKLKDKVQEATNLIGTSWDDYQKKLKYTSQFEAMTFAEMEGHYDGFMVSVVSNMKAVQRATNVSNVITKLETLIDTLTKLGDVLGNLNGSTQSGGITGL